MRPLVLVGVILAALGAFVLLRGATYPKHHDVVKVGDLKATVTDQKPIPTWVGGVALIGGLVLIGAGASRRTS